MRFNQTDKDGAPPALGLALSIKEAMTLRDDLNLGIAGAMREDDYELPARAVVLGDLPDQPLPPATFRLSVHRDLAAAS